MSQLPSCRVSFPRAPLRVVTLASLCMAWGLPAAAAGQDKAILAQLQRLTERLQQVEQRNVELERQLQALSRQTPAPQSATLPDQTVRLQQLEDQNKVLLERVEALSRAPELPEAVSEREGPTFEASVVAVGQQLNKGASATGKSETRAAYRGDLMVTMPAGSIGDAQATVLGHVRFGQGEGVALKDGVFTGAVNSVGFQTAAGADDSFAILAQAYVNLEWPLSSDGFNDLKGNRVELTAGKIDMFGFFDQNAVAGDEASQFLNNVFVHNPLLDSGGDIAADNYGFAPGVRVGYYTKADGPWAWGVSLGLFSAGDSARFEGGMGQPLAIAQVELSPMQINGEPRGSYRLYAWTNGQTTDVTDTVRERHSGVGVSVDQRIGRDWNVFGRWGKRTVGEGAFNEALTLGFEMGGRGWGRGQDGVGFAIGSLKGTGDAGSEYLAELYYRWRLNDHIELSPDLQWIRNPGGDSDAADVRVIGLRASFGF